MPKRPNVVFIITDDQGYGDLGCHGHSYIKTPNIDALYSQSTRLTDYHVCPTCSPTRAGLLTGHYANSTGVWHTVGGRSLLRENERTMASVFKGAGYSTGLFGKWHLGDYYPYRPQDRGFEEVITFGGGGIGNTPDYWNNNYYDDYYCVNGEWKKFEDYCTDVWFREAAHFIERHKDGPFFCYIAPNAPHNPFIVDDKYSKPYKELAESNEEAARFFGYPQTEKIINFCGMVSNIDENIGLLRRKIDELGISDNTIFIFTTDNGSNGGLVWDNEYFIKAGYNAGMRGCKCTPYEGGHRVPFFIHWPEGGLNIGRDVNELTAYIDIFPTLMELCGIGDVKDFDFHGKSLVKLLRGEKASWEERAIVIDSQRLVNPMKWRLSCVMRNSWRLINGHALYDIKSDPEQRVDISRDHPDIVKQLKEDYEKWWAIVSRQFNEEIPIPIGNNDEPVILTCHDWRNIPDSSRIIKIDDVSADDCSALYNQVQIREGLRRIGYWEIDIVRDGRYRFELRRWPKEADLGIGEGIAGKICPYTEEIARGYTGGTAIPIENALIKVADFEQQKAVKSHDRGVVFEAELKAGKTHLEAYFTNNSGLCMSAYYVYAEMIDREVLK